MKFFGYLLLVFSLSFSFESCKVYSFTGANVNANIKTVQIDFFPNRATMGPANLPQAFTDKLKLKMISEANLKQMSKGGDLHFSGFITNYGVVSQSPTAQIQSGVNRLTITVHVDFENTKDLKDKWGQDFSRFADFAGSENLINVENGLIEEINKQLVDDIFNKALVKW